MSLGSDSTLNTLVHPGLLDSIPRVYQAVVEIQKATITQAADGEEVHNWTTVITTRGIFAKASAVARENRMQILTVTNAEYVLDLNGYWPEIEVTHRAIVHSNIGGGLDLILNIKRVDHDSQAAQTRLELEKVDH